MALGTASLSDIWKNVVLLFVRAGQFIPRATYTRASTAAYANHLSSLSVAASGVLRVEWADLDGGGIRETPDYLLEGARTQLVTDPENFGAWTVDNSVARTAGQTDPFGGTNAYLLDSNTPSIFDQIREDVVFTGNATKAISCFMRAGTATQSAIMVTNSVPTDRHRISITWTAGVPTLATANGAGALFPVEAYQSGWYKISINANGVVAADTNRFMVRPDSTGSGGTVFMFGANAWNAPFPASYQGPNGGATSRVADSYVLPWNQSPQDMTILVRFPRPMHADAGASTALGVSPGLFSIGAGTAPRIGGYFDPTTRIIVGVIDTATTDASTSTTIPAGTSAIVAFQFKNLMTGGQVALDAGSGYTAFSSVATGFSSYSSATIRLGRFDDELFGGLITMLVARGLKTRQEMMLLAGIL